MEIRDGSRNDGQHVVRSYCVVLLVFFAISVTSPNTVLAAPIIQPALRATTRDIRRSMSDSSGRTLNRELHPDEQAEGEAEVQVEVEDGESPGGSSARERGGRTSSGQCRVLSLNDAAALLARSTSSQSSAPASHDVRQFLADLGQRLATRTIVLCRAVTAGNTSPDIASSRVPSSSTTDQHYILTSTTRGEKNQHQRLSEQLPGDLKERASTSTGNRNFTGGARERPDRGKHFRPVGHDSNLLRSGTIHRLRHRRHHYRRPIRHRKHISASPFNRDYNWRQSKQTPGSCGGSHVDDDVTGKLDVERVGAIMKAFYCWDDEVARLTNQLRQSADGHLQVTSSISELRCRLIRRYDECRKNFIDKVFRTEHGLPISWPRQITDVMDLNDVME